VWGEALLAELDEVPAGERGRWAMGLVPLLVERTWSRLTLGGLRPFGRDPSTRDGVWLGVAVGAVIAAGLAYANLGPSSSHPKSDPAWASLTAFAVLAVILIAIGFIGRGQGRGVSDCARTALVCAIVLTVITFVTSFVIDNAWLSVVARQPDKIYGLKHSGLFHDMRLYVNAMNVIGLVIVTPAAAAVGAGLGALGALLRGRPGQPELDRGVAG
jgi:hypothetical protein